MRKAYKHTYSLAAIFAAVVLMFATLGGGTAVHAETSDTQTAYEQQNVLHDLNDSVIAGEQFSLSDYPFNDKLTPQIIQFVEFGYSARSSNQGDYGLYVYVYNPQGLAIDTSTFRNKIQFAYGTASYDKYELKFLNYSNASGYEGLFYKFKISISDRRLQEILKNISQDERIYKVSGIELSVKQQLTEYKVAQIYTYSGYALGYGSDLMTESTLSCRVDGLDKYVELDVHQTVYRPKGDYYEGKQSQLNSCYFRVPETYFTDFGELSKIVCEWYEYITKPILVTETNYLYQRLYNLHGNNVKGFDGSNDFLIFSFSNTDTSWFGKKSQGLGWCSDYVDYEESYKVWTGFLELVKFTDEFSSENRFENFAAVFYSGKNKSYKERYVSADELTAQLLSNSEYLGAASFHERYRSTLFTDYVNPDHTRGYNKKTIAKDDLKDVWWNETSKGFWQTIFGGYNVETIYDSVKAIYTVTESDLTGSDEEIANRLYVSENEVDNLKAEFNKCNNERLVLLRYGESDYYSIPCVEAYCAHTENADDILVKDCAKDWIDGNYTAYIAQETVYLDFDIISLWFTSDGAETEIPVIMSPQDVISSLSPPLEENYHNETEKNILKVILALLALIVVVVVLYYTGILPFVVKGLLWLIALPFKLIGSVVRSIGGAAKRRNEKKAKREPKAQQPKPPDLTGNVKPEEVEAYLDSINWDSVDWTKLDGKGG